MGSFLANLFSTDGFMRRWSCGNWSDAHGYLHIGSDIAIFAAYTAIPCVLAFFILRRSDVPFPRILWLFVAFIFACGFGHLIESIIFWHPVYRLSGLVKLTTAVVSWATVFALVQIVPEALNLPGIARLNKQLRAEVDDRKRIEAALRISEGKMSQLLDSERAARADAEQANRIKDDFLSTVSHELRTPLNAILGYSQLLSRGLLGAQEVPEGLAVIERNAKAQAQIIEDLLDMSRISAGKMRLDVAEVDLVHIAEEAIASVKLAADAKWIRIQAVLDPRSAAVFGDSGRLQQVLWNLLTNAIKFTPKGGRIQVVLERVNSHAEIRVSDTGQGIAPEFQSYIFERFRQADSTTSKQHGGLGLGLAIVKHLVELHGGTVRASSAGVGQGAMFTVSLPIQSVQAVADRAAAIQSPAPDSVRELPSLAGAKVLVVDDEPDARDLVCRLLRERGAAVTLAASTDEALQYLQRERPDVIVSDIGMPTRDGYEFIRQVRALPAENGGAVPAIALTALARGEDRNRAMLAGYQSHISKPVDATELVAVVATLTGRTGR